ncbi:MAG: hypothetical protein ABI370_12790 [Gammaproteobacteria bacterium]
MKLLTFVATACLALGTLSGCVATVQPGYGYPRGYYYNHPYYNGYNGYYHRGYYYNNHGYYRRGYWR